MTPASDDTNDGSTKRISLASDKTNDSSTKGKPPTRTILGTTLHIYIKKKSKVSISICKKKKKI